MFILHSILKPLQKEFDLSRNASERGSCFTFTLLSVLTHFTSSRSSNLLRCFHTHFDLNISKRRFYTFMASPKLPWQALWATLWSLIPYPETHGQWPPPASFFDHAAKINQAKYPWAQNVVSIGLLKIVKGRWACLPLVFCFYHMKKTIAAGKVKINGKVLPFQTKFEQAVAMLSKIAEAFSGIPILVITDSWFGNNGLFKPMRKSIGLNCHMLSRLRVNMNLFALPSKRRKQQRGRTKKYGSKIGNAKTLATEFLKLALTYSVNLYGKQRDVVAFDRIVMLKTLKCPVRVVWIYRKSQWVALFTTDLELSVEQVIEYYGARWKIESGFKEIKQEIGSAKSQNRNPHAVTNHLNFCMMAATLIWIYADHLEQAPKRSYAVNNREHFAFSDARKLITQAALDKDFVTLCLQSRKPTQNPFITALMRLVA